MLNMCKSFNIFLFFLLFAFCSSAEVYDLHAKKDPVTNKYGYENKGDKYYWWKEAHCLGANKEEVNQSYETQWVIAPQYDKVSKEFSEGLAAVEINGKVGFIDKYNRFIIPPVFEPMDKLEGFKYGLAAVKKDGKYGFIDKHGIFIFEPVYDGAENFGSDYLAVVKMNKKFGCIDLLGDTVVPCTHLAKEVMKTVPGKNKLYREQKKRAKARWDDGFYDDLLDVVRESETSVGRLLADSTYKVRLPQESEFVVPGGQFEMIGDGFYRVTKNGKSGIADVWGRQILPTEYTSIAYEPELQIFRVTDGTDGEISARAGLATRAGGWIIPPVFNSIGKFDGTLARASIGTCSTLLDNHGMVEWEFIQSMLEQSAQEQGRYYTDRLLGVLPSLPAAHNNLGIYYASEQDDLKHAIKHFSVAHDLAPDVEEFETNMKAAKSERNSRRWNRVLTGMQIAAAVITAGAVTYSAISGNTMSTSDFSSTNSAGVPSSSSGSSGSSSARASASSSKGQSAASATTINTLRRAYDNYETQVVHCNTYPEQHQPGDKKEYQRKMREIRLKLKNLGVDRTISPHETN